MSAAQLTREAKITNGLVTQWRNRTQQPSAKSLSKIADYFNVSLDWLSENEQKEKAPVSEDERLLHEGMDKIKLLPRSEQQRVLDYIEFVIAHQDEH